MILLPGQSNNVNDLMHGISKQWNEQPSACQTLGEAYNATTEVYCAENWGDLEDSNVKSMVTYGFLHETLPERCKVLEPSPELAELCKGRGLPLNIPCIGLYLHVSVIISFASNFSDILRS